MDYIENQYFSLLNKKPNQLTKLDKFILSSNGMLEKIYKLKHNLL